MPEAEQLPAEAPHAENGRLRILAVGVDPAAARQLARWAADDGAEFEPVSEPGTALARLSTGEWDVVLTMLDERPDEELAWWVQNLKALRKKAELIALAELPSIGMALRAAQLGVPNVLSLPVRRDDFQRALSRVRSAVEEIPIPLPPVAAERVGEYALVGQSGAMLEVYKMIARVGPSTATVLVLGESGTGKEVVARAIHLHGPRGSGPFVAVNCAAIPENLLESELFGHEKGAFTGAVTRKIGRFERASGGTLFLDEVADMSLALQSKILRAIEEREIERVGGHEVIEVNVRLIAATNRNLRELVGQGRFREDLYYRLAVVTIRLPRLVERGDDIVLLAAHFVQEFGQRHGKAIRYISDRALEVLGGHEWMGNVRELRNVIERAVLVADGDTLRTEHLPEDWRAGAVVLPARENGVLPTLREAEARHIARVLAQTGGQISAAARILGVHRNTLTRKIGEYGL